VATSIAWQLATMTGVRDETPRVRSLTFRMPDWAGHLPGQHVDLRLTAADGYSVQRSYSIASEPGRGGEVEITVEQIPDGEVSPFLHDVLAVGDRIEVRGPIGGYFVWDASRGGPLLLVAGGSGIVPLMAMLRHRSRARIDVPARLLFSSRHFEEIVYREELARLGAPGHGLDVIHTLTRSAPQRWTGYSRRIDDRMLAEVLEPVGASALTYICGPTALVETAANALARLGVPPDRIRTERFGPSGT